MTEKGGAPPNSTIEYCESAPNQPLPDPKGKPAAYTDTDYTGLRKAPPAGDTRMHGNCNDWTSSTAFGARHAADLGGPGQVGGQWTGNYCYTLGNGCGWLASIYCFEQ
jgi:hypothetical protein